MNNNTNTSTSKAVGAGYSPDFVEGKEGACTALVEVLDPHRDAEAVSRQLQRVTQCSHVGLLGFPEQQIEFTVRFCPHQLKSYYGIPFFCVFVIATTYIIIGHMKYHTVN